MTDRETELYRSNPDFICYAPQDTVSGDATNQHFLVTPTQEGAFLAVWTQASVEAAPDQRIVFSRSEDGGVTWTPPQVLEGPEPGTDRIASWAFPFLVPHSGRIYVFYNKNVGLCDARRDMANELWYRWSDDDGRTWSREHGRLTIRRSAISHPDPQVPDSFIVYQPPIINARGEVMVGFTRLASSAFHREENLFYWFSEVWFLRFDNLLREEDPLKLTGTTLPEGDLGLRVPRPDAPHLSLAQEPTIQNLSDGRLICVMRTMTGMIWYALSSDFGHTWSSPRPLRYCPAGPPILHPASPCPLYKLRDGRFILFYHNNDGTINRASGPADSKRNRNPTYISIGRELVGQTEHPLIFTAPRLFADSQFISYGARPNVGIGPYGSLCEFRGQVYYWYPDRKHFLLGRILGEDLLDDAGLPK